jgi:small subunit ribosomal protein S8
MNTHPIADMLNRIRNASGRGFATVKIPTSRFKEALSKILVETGWIERAEVIKLEETRPYLELTLRYRGQRPIIRGISMISKSGQRIYMGKAKLIKHLPSKLETVIVSTSQGLMTGQEAKKAGVGGEVLFKIW